jgi:hypothetical protein
MTRKLLALFAALCAANAGAQTVYKSIMPDGSVIYGEKPAAGAKKVDTIETPTAKTGTSTITPEEQARAAESRLRAVAPAVPPGRGQEAQDARLALKNAEAAREAGKEPLPTERLGLAGGGSRLSDAYFARQKSLEDAVAAARKRVEEATR